MLSFEEILKKEIVYKIDDIENVNIQKSIVYKSTNKEELMQVEFHHYLLQEQDLIIK